MVAHRVFVDLQAAQSVDSGRRGLGRYGIELAVALIDNGAPIECIGINPLLPKPDLPERILNGPPLVDISADSIDRARLAGRLAYHVMSPMQAPCEIELVLPPAIERADALVMVAYDLIELLFADHYLTRDNRVEQYLGRLRRIKTADLLLAISERTRLDFIEHVGVDPDRIVTIGAAASEMFTPPEPGTDPFAAARRAVPAIDRPFIMSVPAYEWRKNADNLITAFARTKVARRETQLVIACGVPPDGERAWRDLVSEVGLRPDDVVITRFVSDATLRDLYRATRLFVFPSRYEGFGIPVAEASRCGAPSITSDRGSLTEVLDHPASTFDPEDVDAIADAIDRALTDDALRSELGAAAVHATQKHTWDKVAQRTIEAYGRLDRLPAPRRPRTRLPKVAVVASLPPARSPIAAYTARLLSALPGDRFTVDAFADSFPADGWPPAVRAGRVMPASALGATVNPYAYDALVYCIGAGSVEALDASRLRPGVVWLHDVDLAELYLAWAGHRQWALAYGWLGERRRLPVDEILRDAAGTDVPASFIPHAVASSKHLIVNSEAARDVVTRELARCSVAPPVTVVPHPVPDAGMLGLTGAPRAQGPTVVSLGSCGPNARPLVVLEAVAKLVPPTDLVFVGSCPESIERDIRTATERLGMHGRVQITGAVSNDEYTSWLERAHAAVQVRDVDDSELTAAVHDAIGAGLPVVTSGCRELPPGTVAPVGPNATASELAATLRRVLSDRPARAMLERRMRDYAESWTFADVAARVAGIVESTIAASSQPFIARQGGGR